MPTGNSPSVIRRRPWWRFLLPSSCLAVVVLTAPGCRRDMYDQPKYDAYDATTFFKDGTSGRQQIAGTVARGDEQVDPLFYHGKMDGKDATEMPFEVTAEVLALGEQRYTIFCTPCHGRDGNGKGMVVRRGFSPPPTFHQEYLRKKPVGHFFSVITNGYGAMYSYASRIPVRDRWAIIAYIRALQYSRTASLDDLEPDERTKLEHPPEAGTAEGTKTNPAASNAASAEAHK